MVLRATPVDRRTASRGKHQAIPDSRAPGHHSPDHGHSSGIARSAPQAACLTVTLHLAIRLAAVRQDHLAGWFIAGVACQQDLANAKTAAFHAPGRKHRCRMALPGPWGHYVIPDVAPGFRKFGRQPVPPHKGSQVVLAGDVPEDRGWHSSSCSPPAPCGDEPGEVLAGRSQPICRRAPEQAIGLLVDEVGRPHYGRRPHQAGLLNETDHTPQSSR